MLVVQLVLKLEHALGLAQMRDVEAMECILEEVRDASYDLVLKQSAFMIRTACSAVEHVASSFDPISSSQTALVALQRVKETFTSGTEGLNAA
ncbi:hypothetical protein [Pacificibacter marinus]|uniref:Uncharacterized protein n=1 Tax=Pacificibacter marinus TaxID=658057 RepID=A0A1Y5SWW1_9RHOB|nr:hypothetical protein [Pacificibacter marinus]SEK86363.1 hypothetical protein SAMN04488032_107163 [Pacificibacter marinus]SLN50276.1 hypothetical protein PAM7971_02484 [Pacificibacter marinus]